MCKVNGRHYLCTKCETDKLEFIRTSLLSTSTPTLYSFIQFYILQLEAPHSFLFVCLILFLCPRIKYIKEPINQLSSTITIIIHIITGKIVASDDGITLMHGELYLFLQCQDFQWSDPTDI